MSTQRGWEVLRKRAEFLAVAGSGRRHATPRLVLQVGEPHALSEKVRFGVTASKKVGNAVARARAKRRLRALTREVLVSLARADVDYVLVARPDAVECEFSALKVDLEAALKRLKQRRDTP